MNWRRTGRVWSAALTIGATALVAQSASAQRDGYERVLAGIRLNTSAKDVLRKFGNPNQIIIGDVGMRAPAQGGGGTQGMPGGMMGGPPGGMMGGPPGGMMGGGMSGPPGGGGSLPGGPGKGGGMSGGSSMMGGPPGGMGGGGPMMSSRGGGGLDGDAPSMGAAGGGPPGGMMGGGPPGGFGGQGMMGGGGPGMGPFGQTTSTAARQQEVTWIYNRKFKDVKGNTNVVSYEFLVGPGGRISQIRVLGYYSKGTRTQRGVVLGSTYKDLVRLYGYPEEHIVNNGVLIASYKNKAHAQFQLIQSKPGADPSLQNYKIIAITIASVE
jgi:hypothetical protein